MTAEEYLRSKVISQEIIVREEIPMPEDFKEKLGMSSTKQVFMVEDRYEPRSTYRDEDIKKALEMARKECING